MNSPAWSSPATCLGGDPDGLSQRFVSAASFRSADIYKGSLCKRHCGLIVYRPGTSFALKCYAHALIALDVALLLLRSHRRLLRAIGVRIGTVFVIRIRLRVGILAFVSGVALPAAKARLSVAHIGVSSLLSSKVTPFDVPSPNTFRVMEVPSSSGSFQFKCKFPIQPRRHPFVCPISNVRRRS